MNELLGLQMLAKLLEWEDSEATREYKWLRFMSRYKFDGYQDFVAGMRFIATLISWLKQFPTLGERRIAYAFVRRRLVYLGPAELNHLVRLMYPEVIRPRLARAVATHLGIAQYLVWSAPQGRETYKHLLRQSLFIGLSDGARLDVFRRSNSGTISNEQVILAPQIHVSKWKSTLEKLRKTEGGAAKFRFVFLLDDFVASGKSLIRKEEAEGRTGKLVRFWEDIRDFQEYFSDDWVACVHHHVATSEAAAIVSKRAGEAALERGKDWFPSVEFSYGLVLPPDTKLTDPVDDPILELVDLYYDPSIETRHTEVGGSSVARGFAGCALPVVLDHNTPNNSIALLWAESTRPSSAHQMRPLFRRRQRHV
jgi:hypothetical protein